MSDPKDRNPRSPPPQPGADHGKRSGRAGVDERGNSVWEWQLETGVYSRDISTQKLRKLDLGDLSIAETASHQRPAGLGEKDKTRKKISASYRAAASILMTIPAVAAARRAAIRTTTLATSAGKCSNRPVHRRRSASRWI